MHFTLAALLVLSIVNLSLQPYLMLPDSKNISSHRNVLFLFLALSLLYFGFSWMRPLASPDEPRYSEIPREMLASGDWVAPRLNGILYFYKPPLFYWLVAAAEYVGGINNIAVRFWPAAFGLIGCAAVYAAGKRLYNRQAGFYAALVLGTSLLYFGLSQIIILDMTFSVLMSAALLCFITGQKEPVGSTQRQLFHAFYALIALAVMTKGILAIMLPGAIIFLWFLLMNQWKKLWRIYIFSGTLIVLIIALPWHLIVSSRHTQWFDFYIIHEHFQRYLSNASHREQPFWFFLAVLPAGLLPWVCFLPQSIKAVLPGGWQKRQDHVETWFLLIWAVFALAFFSASKSKLIPYILPVFPPLALMIGRFLAVNEEQSHPRSLKWCYSVNGITFLVIAIGLLIAAPIQQQSGKINGDFMPWVIPASIVIGMAGIQWLWWAGKDRRFTIWPLAAGTVAISMLANPLIALFQPPSIKPIVTQLQNDLKSADLVFSYEEYFHDLPLYLGKTVGVVEAVHEEQSFGLEWEDHTDRYIRMNSFRKIWRNKSIRVFAVMKTKEVERFRQHIKTDIHEVVSDANFCVYTNTPLGKR